MKKMTPLEIKLCSVVVHLIERASVGGHAFDDHAIDGLLQSPDVAEALAPSVMLPVTRSGKSALELWQLRK